jgi:hypothetical protein
MKSNEFLDHLIHTGKQLKVVHMRPLAYSVARYCQGGGPREDRLRVATSERGANGRSHCEKEECCLRDSYVLKTRKRDG